MDKKEINKNLPIHLFDPLRRKIGINIMRHEFAKLFRSKMPASSYKEIDKIIQDRYKKLPAEKFWNEIHSITMGFEQTNFVFWATSLNVVWSERKIPIDELWSGRSYEEIGATGMASDIKEKIFLPENKKYLKRVQDEMKVEFSGITSREEFPIFVIKKNGRLRVVDGNTRLMKAIVSGEKSIKAIIGEPSVLVSEKPVFYEHWVPTTLLIDLVYLYKWQNIGGRENTLKYAGTIAEIIRDTSAGQFEFFERVIHKDDEVHTELSKMVSEILAKEGIIYKLEN